MGLWRIYADTNAAREALLYEGSINVRGKNVTIHGVNPGTRSRYEENSIRVRVKHVPLSADDGQIARTITLHGCTVTNMYRERLRYDGRLTNCETGDRILMVTDLTTPLPRTMSIGKYRAVVLYRGQPDDRKECSKCLQKGHSSNECEDEVVCRNCLCKGHISADCPRPLDNYGSEESASEDEGEEADVEDENTAAMTAWSTTTDDQPTEAVVNTEQPEPSNTMGQPQRVQEKTTKVNNHKQKTPKKSTSSKANSAQGSILKFLNDTPQRKSSNIPPDIRSPPTPTEQMQVSQGRGPKEQKSRWK